MYTNGKNQRPTGVDASPGKFGPVWRPRFRLSSSSDHLLVCYANRTLEFRNSMHYAEKPFVFEGKCILGVNRCSSPAA